MVAKATPKALQVLEEAKKEKGEELTLLEKINVAGPVYIPSVLIGASTIACIIGANVLNRHRQASLMSAYALLDQSFKDYKKKVVELYGEEVDAKVEEELAKDNKPGENDEVYLFFDERSGRYFESTLFKVQEAEYRINRQLMMSDYASLNDWYEALDLDIVEDGYILGWTPSMLLDYYWQPWLDFDHEHWTTKDGRKCITIRFWQEPTKDWENYC